MYLLYINELGQDYKGQRQYEFIFGEDPNVLIEEWFIIPSAGRAVPPEIEHIDLVGLLKNSDLKLPKLVTGEYKIVGVSNGELTKSFEELNREVELTEYEQKKSKHESIASLFSNEPKVPKTKEVIPINYERINKNNTLIQKYTTDLFIVSIIYTTLLVDQATDLMA